MFSTIPFVTHRHQWILEAMIGDTNLFFNESDQPNTAEVEIMIADVTYRRRKRGWEAIILMLLYGTCIVLFLS